MQFKNTKIVMNMIVKCESLNFKPHMNFSNTIEYLIWG